MAAIQPSIRTIFSWTAARYETDWRTLTVLLLITEAPTFLAHLIHGGNDLSHDLAGNALLSGGLALIASLGVAACAWSVVQSQTPRIGDALKLTALESPRLAWVRVLTISIRYGLPIIALAVLHLPPWMMSAAAIFWYPLAFGTQLTFVAAAVEEVSAVTALQGTYALLRAAGIEFLMIATVITVAMEQLPQFLLLLAAHEVFPTPPNLPVFGDPALPAVLPGIFPPHMIGIPNVFAAYTPWYALEAIRIVTLPLIAYITTWYAGAVVELQRARNAVPNPEPAI